MDDQRTDRKGGMRIGRTQFSLKAMLLVMTMFALCSSSYLVGHYNGTQTGYKLGAVESEAHWLAVHDELQKKSDDLLQREKAWYEAANELTKRHQQMKAGVKFPLEKLDAN